jgi:hypothetical protein
MKQTTRSSSNLPLPTDGSGLSRRSFLTKASVAGAIAMAPFSVLANGVRNDHQDDEDQAHLKKRDLAILIAAEIAEALAVTTYTHIINQAPFSVTFLKMTRII